MKNTELISKVIKLALEERRIGVEILELLREIETRKAYSELGYDGLFSFCVKELRYSDSQAVRRIQAMRAMSEIPELKDKIKSGALTVTTVSQVQTHLRKENLFFITANEKLQLFKSFENKSAKEVETSLSALSGEDSTVMLSIRLDPEMKEAWEQIRNISAHSTRSQDTAILKMLMLEWIQNHRIVNSLKKDKVRYSLNHTKTRTIPISIKRFVWVRDQNKCTNCGSKYALQFDHRTPYSRGGTNTPENIRLLCRSCNIAAGIKLFGLQKMKRVTEALQN